MREEVWQDENGKVAKYNLAYINFSIFTADNSHDRHHRHFMGAVQSIKFKGYFTLASRFHDEVRELWEKEDEKNG